MHEAGESKTRKFTVTRERMSFYNQDGKLTLEPREFRLDLGGFSPPTRTGSECAKSVTATCKVK